MVRCSLHENITVLFRVRRLHQGSTEESVAADWSASHHNTSQSRTVGPSPSGGITDLQRKEDSCNFMRVTVASYKLRQDVHCQLINEYVFCENVIR